MAIVPRGTFAVRPAVAPPPPSGVNKDQVLVAAQKLLGVDKLAKAGLTGAGYSIVMIDGGVDLTVRAMKRAVVDGFCFSRTDKKLGMTSSCPAGVKFGRAQPRGRIPDLRVRRLRARHDGGVGHCRLGHGERVSRLCARREDHLDQYVEKARETGQGRQSLRHLFRRRPGRDRARERGGHDAEKKSAEVPDRRAQHQPRHGMQRLPLRYGADESTI
ncbi:hypothetical protein [Chenggangzhangella methanolivorans]|uniref:Uncharacterized protein n=1 Tax=Chenggangzhangella methanolivorans TaxID=1437009 RepID=A0A9E6R720_9HYPH|nr:hypothetical protein [Chenggangzhangella methanolivorans]QZN99158.1 hypothetical protein K6K41_20310 [Chenggangzhangella methanolivorans]